MLLCFIGLMDVIQNILRFCSQRVGSHGGELCFAPETPEHAHGGQVGVVAGEDVHIAVSNEKCRLGVCPDVLHQGIDASRVGFGGHAFAAAPLPILRLGVFFMTRTGIEPMLQP